ncbi:MAG: sugar ABC transporter permease [Lactobacillaceae bacterium]|jgi:arabinogalactan oligomer/maltooligosaccharide transport system permease protein|nr:sugar ABC transporter permease [Lactobacillaceae bacterium]
MKSLKGVKKRNTILLYIILSVMAFVWVIPIVWIILTSFRAEGGAFVNYFWPKHYTLHNYVQLFTNSQYPFGRWFLNTLFVSVISGVVSTLFVLSMAYSLSRLKFKLKGPFLKVALVLNMFPGFMAMFAIYYILKAADLTQSLLALILVYISGAGLGFYIQKGFFDTIPYSLDESAMLDGATKWEIFTKITLPLSKPIIVFTALTAFIGPWMDFIFAQVIMGDNVQNYTVAIGLYSMMTKETANSLFMSFAAGSVIIAVPITILFIVLQRFYVSGVTSGSVKG